MAARVNKETFEAAVLNAEKPVLVEFYSDSCVPCKQMTPVLGDIEDDHEDGLKVVKVNVNYDGELAEKYDVLSTPTLLLFAEGVEVNRVHGFLRKEELEELVKQVLN